MRLRLLIEELALAFTPLYLEHSRIDLDEEEDYATRHFRLYPHTIHHHATHVKSGVDKNGHTISHYHHKETNTHHIIKSAWTHGGSHHADPHHKVPMAQKSHKHLYSTGLAKDADAMFHSLTVRKKVA
jgi:hypothetical protein